MPFSDPPRVQLFIAYPVTQVLRDCAARWSEEESGIRWMTPENLHITVTFIGPASRAEAHAIGRELAELRMPEMEAFLDRVGVFENAGALWLGVVAPITLFAIKTEIDRILDDRGIVYDLKPFRPHATIARYRGRLTPAQMDIVRARVTPDLPIRMPLTRPILYQSLQDETGTRYLPVG